MKLQIAINSATGAHEAHLTVADQTLFLCNGHVVQGPDGAEIAVHRGQAGTPWIILSPAAALRAQVMGRPVVGRIVDLTSRPLTLDGFSYEAVASGAGAHLGVAEQDGQCPVCHLPISAGDEVLACSCGLVTCSRFCAAGGAEEARCLRCGQSLPAKGGDGA